MAVNRVHIEASPERVFDVLADAERYSEWVVGASDVVDFDADFPAAGSRFHHRVGARPFVLADHTEVLELDRPRLIVLRAKARPLGTAKVVLEVAEGVRGGAEVVMTEMPGDRLSALVAANPLADLILRIRNAEALSRLKRAVEERPTGPVRRRRELAGQRVLITGGSSGIGLAVAELLAAGGANVVLLARGEEGLAAARERVEAAVPGARVETLAADVRDREALADAVARAADLLGGLDVLVTAAAGAAWGPFAETDPAAFDATVETVLGGTANAIRAALPTLEESAGAVVCLGSTAGRLPVPGMSAYSAAKHGLVGLLDTLRLELREAGSPTTVSLVSPGPVDTPLWDNLESQTGLLPPVPPDRYSPQAVAAAVVSVIRRPREEITVGGSASLQVHLWSLLRAPTGAALATIGRLGQTAADKVAGTGSLYSSRGAGEVDGGHGGRGSLAVRGTVALESIARRIRR